MKKFINEDRKVVSAGKTKRVLTDEDLRKIIRHAVKNTNVPADLESKLQNLIGKQL